MCSSMIRESALGALFFEDNDGGVDGTKALLHAKK